MPKKLVRIDTIILISIDTLRADRLSSYGYTDSRNVTTERTN